MAKKTCMNRDGMDHISNLPDDVLVQILSLVSTEQAYTTSFLSKRWKSLWTLIPTLDFDYASFCKTFSVVFEDQRKVRWLQGFLKFVNCVFAHHQVEHLQMLRFACNIVLFKDYLSEVRRVVGLVKRRNCLTLDLQFSDPARVLYPAYRGMFTLTPNMIEMLTSVTHLKLTNCKLTVSKYKSFLSVKIVKLTVVALLKDSVHDLVSKCPCLEELHLVHCSLPSSSFELNSPESNLKCLVLQNCISSTSYNRTFSHVSINIPTLSRLKYDVTPGYPSINNAENLIEAEINMFFNQRYEHEYKLLCKLLMDLRNAKVLTLRVRYLEVLDTNGGRSLLNPLCNLKHLQIELWRLKIELPSLMCLLRNSPCLESLSINFGVYVDAKDMIPLLYNDDEVTILEPLSLPSDCAIHLVKIEIKNFNGLKVEMKFVEIMLQSSLCLKEMVIFIRSRYRLLKQRIGKEHHEVLQKKKAAAIENILACTCASPDAKILIK
ncbi:hypothetical protein MKW94_022987 [Papaver nudicaule]|uniref:F-box domain-containing protein n=1 Tax=Papaver nudicaule TaxID=74823 RepID=A0AA41S9Z5_PAPNU|nr:hypothetical protein [Papaver nudicaule]